MSRKFIFLTIILHDKFDDYLTCKIVFFLTKKLKMQILIISRPYLTYIIPLLLVLVVPVLFLITYYHLFYILGEGDGMSPFGEIRPKIKSNTSIAFYIPINSTRKMRPDYRTRLWEKQLKDFTGKYVRHYVAGFPQPINGFKLLNFSEGYEFDDFDYCIRFTNTLKHFKTNYADYKWFVFADVNTYINLSRFVDRLNEMEKTNDPMKNEMYSYGLTHNDEVVLPYQKTGLILSNKAVHSISSHDLSIDQCEYNMLNEILAKIFKSKSFIEAKYFGELPYSNMHLITSARYGELPKCTDKANPLDAPIFLNLGKFDATTRFHLFHVAKYKLGIAWNDNKSEYCKL